MEHNVTPTKRRWYTTVESEAGVLYVLGHEAVTHLLEVQYELDADAINALMKMLYDNGAVMFYTESA